MPAELASATSLACPKHMEYGPCGGVEFDGTCEVAPHPCVFLDTPTVRWQGGVDVWTGINCRDRNRVAIEGELAALAHADVAGVHCVTGDHTDAGSRPDAAPVFDLDSTSVASLARALGSRLGFIPCIPIVVSRESAELLATFTTLVLPPGYLGEILASRDPHVAGIRAAVALGREFLTIDGVVGLNLSGDTAPGGETTFAEALGTIGDELAPHLRYEAVA